MKIVVYPSGGSPVTLGDDAVGDYVTAELPSQTRIVSTVPLYKAEFQAVFSGGNRLNTFSWQTDRQHTTRAAAAAFKMTHADSVPLLGLVQIVQENASRWLASAVIPEVRCLKHNGRSTVFSYTVIGGKFLTRNPNT